MKLKKLTTALAALGIVSASGVVSAQTITPAPKLSAAEEAALAVSEAQLSLVAAMVTKSGCGALTAQGPLPFTINTNAAGTGSSSFGPVATTDPIEINVAQGGTVFGAFYDLTQVGDGTLTTKIQGYTDQTAFSENGEIFIASPVFQVYEFSNFVQWDEHIIKDFWLQNVNGHVVLDDGLEVITKLNYPITKWRQESSHTRSNGGPGPSTVTKNLIPPANTPVCTIQATGTWVGFLGGLKYTGTIVVI